MTNTEEVTHQTHPYQVGAVVYRTEEEAYGAMVRAAALFQARGEVHQLAVVLRYEDRQGNVRGQVLHSMDLANLTEAQALAVRHQRAKDLHAAKPGVQPR